MAEATLGHARMGVKLAWLQESHDFVASLAPTSKSLPQFGEDFEPLLQRAGRCCCSLTSSNGVRSTETRDYAQIADRNLESSSATGRSHPDTKTSAYYFVQATAAQQPHALRGGGDSGWAQAGGHERNVQDDEIDDISTSFPSSCSDNSLPFPPRCCAEVEDTCGAGGGFGQGESIVGEAEAGNGAKGGEAWMRNIPAAEWWRDTGVDKMAALNESDVEEEDVAVEEGPVLEQEVKIGQEAMGGSCNEMGDGVEASGFDGVKWGGEREEVEDISVPEEKDGSIRVIPDKPRPEPREPREELLDTEKYQVVPVVWDVLMRHACVCARACASKAIVCAYTIRNTE